MIAQLDKVWAILRQQRARTGHNVVVYFSGTKLRFAAGVEVPDGFTPAGDVQPVDTPAGEAAVAVHWGDYARLSEAYDALDRWCKENQRQTAGINWEVYGDWSDDPAKVRTDVYALLEA